MLAGVVLAKLVGRLVGCPRPLADLVLFGADSTFAFPSGPVVGACDFLLVEGVVVAVDTWRTARIPGEQVTGILSEAGASRT